jgi:hypothetical protein
MFRVKHRTTEQVCEFDSEDGLDGFLRGIEEQDGLDEASNWAIVEDAPGEHVELTGKPVEPSGRAAELTDDVLEKAAADIAAGAFNLAYAVSGISSHYGVDRKGVEDKLVALVAPKLGLASSQGESAASVEAELEHRAQERVRAEEQRKAEAESRSGG